MARRRGIVPGAFGKDRSSGRPPSKGKRERKTTTKKPELPRFKRGKGEKFLSEEIAVLAKEIKLNDTIKRRDGNGFREFHLRTEMAKPLGEIPWQVIEEISGRIDKRNEELLGAHDQRTGTLNTIYQVLRNEWQRRFMT